MVNFMGDDKAYDNASSAYGLDSVMSSNSFLSFVHDVSIDWDALDRNDYVRTITALATIKRLTFVSPVTFFVGENGTGKSTLLEAIAVAYGFNAEGGTLNYRFSTYDDVSGLSRALTLGKERAKSQSSYFLRAESFFNLATKAEEYDRSSGPGLHQQSHGESFMSFFHRFNQAGLYLMDEPEAAISPQRQLELLVHIHDLVGKGAQFIIATHSPILLSLPGARILDFDQSPLHPCDYEDTDSYRVTELVINHRVDILARLLGE
jgi:predicted ATPase